MDDVERAAEVIPGVVAKVRKLAGVLGRTGGRAGGQADGRSVGVGESSRAPEPTARPADRQTAR
jgi:hypothetical protein